MGDDARLVELKLDVVAYLWHLRTERPISYPSTIRYASMLRAFARWFGDSKLPSHRTLTDADLERYREHLHAAGHRNNYLRCLVSVAKGLGRFCMGDGRREIPGVEGLPWLAARAAPVIFGGIAPPRDFEQRTWSIEARHNRPRDQLPRPSHWVRGRKTTLSWLALRLRAAWRPLPTAGAGERRSAADGRLPPRRPPSYCKPTGYLPRDYVPMPQGLWLEIAAHIPGYDQREELEPDLVRSAFEGAVYVLATGRTWHSLDGSALCGGRTAFNGFVALARAGVFRSLWRAGLLEREPLNRVNWPSVQATWGTRHRRRAGMAVGPLVVQMGPAEGEDVAGAAPADLEPAAASG
jgi:hypothetical protein